MPSVAIWLSFTFKLLNCVLQQPFMASLLLHFSLASCTKVILVDLSLPQQ